MRSGYKISPLEAVASVSVQYAPGVENSAAAPIQGEQLAGLMRCMSRLVGTRTDVRLLDLGCGTGLYTIALAKNLGYETVGADWSPLALAAARKKSQSDIVQWQQQDATALSYGGECFDIVFMSNLLDLVKNPHVVVRECSRVLKPGGLLVYHYGALEDVLREPEHKFFPETVEFDYLRTPARKQVETWFKEASLADVTSERDTYRPWKTAQDRLLAVEEKATVSLQSLDFQSYNQGLSRLRAYTASSPMDPWLREQTLTTTYGRKNR
jgi:SAM-dependent methyltransferase